MFNDQIRQINDQIIDLPSFDNIDNIDLDLSEIIAVLQDNNIAIERPSLNQRPIRSGDRRGPPPRRQLSDHDVSDRRDTSVRKPLPRTQRSDTSRDVEARPSVRQPVREPVREPARESRLQQSRTEPTGYEDDTDLIGEVRRQQVRV